MTTYTNHTCEYCDVGYEVDHQRDEPAADSLAFRFCCIPCAEHAGAIPESQL